MDIAQYIYPSSNKAIMKMLRKKVAELRSSIRMLEQRGIVRDPSLEAALQDAEELRDLLARGREKLFQFGMYITLYADDDERLKKLQTDVESILGGKLVLTKKVGGRTSAWVMKYSFTCLPVGPDGGKRRATICSKFLFRSDVGTRRVHCSNTFAAHPAIKMTPRPVCADIAKNGA